MYHVTHLTESCMRDYSRLIFIETTGTRCRPKHSSLIPQKSLIWYLRIFRSLGVCELCTADGAGLRWATDETSVTVEKKSDNLGMDAPRFLWAAAWIPHGPLQGDPWAASVSSPLSIPSDDMFCWQHRLPLRCHFANSKKPPSRSCWETRSHTRLFSQWFQVNTCQLRLLLKPPFVTDKWFGRREGAASRLCSQMSRTGLRDCTLNVPAWSIFVYYMTGDVSILDSRDSQIDLWHWMWWNSPWLQISLTLHGSATCQQPTITDFYLLLSMVNLFIFRLIHYLLCVQNVYCRFLGWNLPISIFFQFTMILKALNHHILKIQSQKTPVGATKWTNVWSLTNQSPVQCKPGLSES